MAHKLSPTIEPLDSSFWVQHLPSVSLEDFLFFLQSVPQLSGSVIFVSFSFCLFDTDELGDDYFPSWEYSFQFSFWIF